MKIYDMIEGVWLKDEKITEKKEKPDILPRLVLHEKNS